MDSDREEEEVKEAKNETFVADVNYQLMVKQMTIGEPGLLPVRIAKNITFSDFIRLVKKEYLPSIPDLAKMPAYTIDTEIGYVGKSKTKMYKANSQQTWADMLPKLWMIIMKSTSLLNPRT